MPAFPPPTPPSAGLASSSATRSTTGQRRRADMRQIDPLDVLDGHPPYLAPDYRSTRTRAPTRPLVVIPPTLSELTGPRFGHDSVLAGDADLTRQHDGEPLGERIIVGGRVADED